MPKFSGSKHCCLRISSAGGTPMLINKWNGISNKILPRPQRSLDIVGNGYKKGQVDFLHVLTSHVAYIRVNRSNIIVGRVTSCHDFDRWNVAFGQPDARIVYN